MIKLNDLKNVRKMNSEEIETMCKRYTDLLEKAIKETNIICDTVERFKKEAEEKNITGYITVKNRYDVFMNEIYKRFEWVAKKEDLLDFDLSWFFKEKNVELIKINDRDYKKAIYTHLNTGEFRSYFLTVAERKNQKIGYILEELKFSKNQLKIDKTFDNNKYDRRLPQYLQELLLLSGIKEVHYLDLTVGKILIHKQGDTVEETGLIIEQQKNGKIIIKEGK